jgi:8-hydroxy-5-deazaflavin:NADPH oxidoreductase
MRIGVMGTGAVGQAIATRLVAAGHDVRMGSRAAGNEAAVAWADSQGESASQGSFAEAAAFADELVFNCTAGSGAVAAVDSAGPELEGKALVDVSNPLEPTDAGMALSVGVTDSLAEQIQRTLPNTWVVKSLNTMTAGVMVDPDSVPGDHVVFVCGDDEAAKAKTVAILGDLGWPRERVVDLGDISAARATEAYVLLWVRMMGTLGGAHFNIEVRR